MGYNSGFLLSRMVGPWLTRETAQMFLFVNDAWLKVCSVRLLKCDNCLHIITLVFNCGLQELWFHIWPLGEDKVTHGSFPVGQAAQALCVTGIW